MCQAEAALVWESGTTANSQTVEVRCAVVVALAVSRLFELWQIIAGNPSG